MLGSKKISVTCAYRSITPPFARGLDINGSEIFNFLFPDGSVFSAHWTSYAILALVLAVAVELSTRLLMLLSQVCACTYHDYLLLLSQAFPDTRRGTAAHELLTMI